MPTAYAHYTSLLCFALWWWNSYLVLATSLAFIPSPCYRYTNRVATIGVTHTAPVWLGLALFINTTFWVGLKRGLVICELRAAKWRTGNMRTNMRTRPLIGRDVTRAPHAVRKVPHGVHSSHCFVSRPNEPYCSIAESRCISIFMTTVFGQLFMSVSYDLTVWIGSVYGFIDFFANKWHHDNSNYCWLARSQ